MTWGTVPKSPCKERNVVNISNDGDSTQPMTMPSAITCVQNQIGSLDNMSDSGWEMEGKGYGPAISFNKRNGEYTTKSLEENTIVHAGRCFAKAYIPFH